MSPDAHELLTDATVARRPAGRLPGRPERPEFPVSGDTPTSPGERRPIGARGSTGEQRAFKPCGRASRPPGAPAPYLVRRPAASRPGPRRLAPSRGDYPADYPAAGDRPVLSPPASRRPARAASRGGPPEPALGGPGGDLDPGAEAEAVEDVGHVALG